MFLSVQSYQILLLIYNTTISFEARNFQLKYLAAIISNLRQIERTTISKGELHAHQPRTHIYLLNTVMNVRNRLLLYSRAIHLTRNLFLKHQVVYFRYILTINKKHQRRFLYKFFLCLKGFQANFSLTCQPPTKFLNSLRILKILMKIKSLPCKCKLALFSCKSTNITKE